MPATPPRRTLRSSFGSARAHATTEEKVRGFLAIFLVLILIAMVIRAPDGKGAVAAVASAKTLSIAVIAFYFGLHKGTPQASPARGHRGTPPASPAASPPAPAHD